ncbi:MAG: hypothetical protein IJC66_00370 [Kiritimatiellae bacterium]|nr:hypothetical protein [Kiritimatiellia bacterium]
MKKLRNKMLMFAIMFVGCLQAEDFIDQSDPANNGFLYEVARNPIEVSAATSMVAAVNGEWRSIGESNAIALRSDSFRALTIVIR